MTPDQLYTIELIKVVFQYGSLAVIAVLQGYNTWRSSQRDKEIAIVKEQTNSTNMQLQKQITLLNAALLAKTEEAIKK